MVIKMGSPQIPEPLHLHFSEVMNTVMRHVISQITHSEPGGISPYPCVEQGPGQGKQQDSDQQAQPNGHDQPFLVIRVLVVYAVKQKTDAFLEFSAWRKMKDVAVEQVFKQSPDSKPEEK